MDCLGEMGMPLLHCIGAVNGWAEAHQEGCCWLEEGQKGITMPHAIKHRGCHPFSPTDCPSGEWNRLGQSLL